MSVLLSLGSNVGDREGFISTAISAMDKLNKLDVLTVSHCYETEPVGGVNQPNFINLAVEIETALEPLELLKAIKEIEEKLGRKKSVRWGPREIDIDIVLWDDIVINTDELTIPHPEYQNRAFVMEPLVEIAPMAIDPLTQMTIAELSRTHNVEGKVIRQQLLKT